MPVWLLALVAAAALLATLGTLSYDFVYDDDFQVLRNTWIRDWSNLGKIFTTNVWAFSGVQGVSNYYRPLHMLLYMAAYSLGGVHAYAFHLCNIILHALCCVLVALIGFRLTRNRFVAAAAGLLFAVHPIHAESVAWVAGVTDPLCAVFYFAALYFYLKSAEDDHDRQSLALSLGCFFAALFSKEMAFTFPVIALWLDWSLHRRLRWSRYAMFAGLFAIHAAIRVYVLGTFSHSQNFIALGPLQLATNALVMFGHYFMKMFVPYGISPFHVFTPASTMMTIVMMVLLAALAAIGWKIRHHRALLFLLGFAVLTIAPTLNLRGIGENVFADRYLYIPSLASCILVPAAVYAACKTWAARPAWLDYRIGAVVLVLVLVSSGWMLSGELAIWRNNPTLYHETIRRSPEAALIAHNLGRDYYYKGDIQNAKLWETKAYELWNRTFAKSTGTLTNITIGLGGILYQEGRIAEARDYFMKAYELAPNSEAILQNLGTVSLALRDYQKALQYYDAALKLNPNSEVTYSNLAAIYLSAGQFDQAIANAQRALEIFPRFGDAGANLARAYNAKGMKAEAFAAYEKLKIIDPSRTGWADAEMKALAARK